MTSAKTLFVSMLVSLLLTGLAACTTTPAADTAEEVARREAEFETQRLFEEARLQEQREKEAAERAIAEQQAIRDANNAAAEAEAQARRQAEADAQREADLRAYRERNAEPAADQASDQASEQTSEEVARQQARVAELRRQIAANKAETETLEASNTALREAIAAAEDLSRTLAEEQKKYSSVDPAAGPTVDAVAKTRIEELKAQVERLKAQAAALSQPAP